MIPHQGRCKHPHPTPHRPRPYAAGGACSLSPRLVVEPCIRYTIDSILITGYTVNSIPYTICRYLRECIIVKELASCYTIIVFLYCRKEVHLWHDF